MSIPASPPVTGEIVPLLVAPSVLVVVGTLWSIVSLAYLGRCFGIFPEARGLVTRGPYRWIRPLYMGEITSSLGLVVASASPILFGVFIVFCGFQYWRARLEERVLTEAFPDYATYALRTARILPGLH
jgi:protein-S-isoprenylcysteine O-methyltransferase Ste14